MTEDTKKISKLLSLTLRHKPEVLGLTLDAGGWAEVDQIIAGADMPLTREMIATVVRDSDKQRFALSGDGTRIRANQGHSIAGDLGLTPAPPPDILFHGTADRTLAPILEQGLIKQSRQHVHLSPDAETARKVGMRHGKPVILTITAGQMQCDGHVFFRSANGVWLTDLVPPRYIRIF